DSRESPWRDGAEVACTCAGAAAGAGVRLRSIITLSSKLTRRSLGAWPGALARTRWVPGAFGKWPTNGFDGICTPSMLMVADDGVTDTERTTISMLAVRGGGGGAGAGTASSGGGAGAGRWNATSAVVARNTVASA